MIFYIDKQLAANRNSFTPFVNMYALYLFFLALCMALIPVQFLMEVVRTDIFTMFSIFYEKYNVICTFCTDILHEIKKSPSGLLRIFFFKYMDSRIYLFFKIN